MFPASTSQKNHHNIPLLTVLTTHNPSNPAHLLEGKSSSEQAKRWWMWDEGLLTAAHSSRLPGSQTQGSRCIPCGRQEETDHQNGLPDLLSFRLQNQNPLFFLFSMLVLEPVSPFPLTKSVHAFSAVYFLNWRKDGPCFPRPGSNMCFLIK